MANSKLNRLVERVTQPDQPELGDNALLVCERIRNRNLERLGQLKDAAEFAISEIQKSVVGTDKAANWNGITVQLLNPETVLIEKAESPYIYCTLKLVEDNRSIQGIVRAAQHRPEPNAVVEERVRIVLTTKNGKPSYSLNGKTFSSVDSLSHEILVKIRDTVNQDPAVVRLLAAQKEIDAEMKRGVKAAEVEYRRNLKARQKRDARADKRRDAKAGRWP